jgi:TetR/AcrR family transcriptional regulator
VRGGVLGRAEGKRRNRRFGRRSAKEAEQTRRVILEAALGLFARRGFEGVSIRDVAEEAGTTHSLIRHHYGSKEGVWRAVVDAADAEYASAMRPIVADAAQEEDPEVAVARIVRGVVRTSARHPEIARLLVHEGACGGERLDYILERVRPLRESVSELFARLRQRELLGQFDEDTFFLLILTAGTVPFALSALSEHVLGEDALTQEYADRHAERISKTLFGSASSPQSGGRMSKGAQAQSRSHPE